MTQLFDMLPSICGFCDGLGWVGITRGLRPKAAHEAAVAATEARMGAMV